MSTGAANSTTAVKQPQNGSDSSNTKRVHNFNAGPAALPESVLKLAQSDLLNYNETGMSIMEISHRSKSFDKIIVDAESDLRQLLQLNSDWSILFLQGGATSQFSAIPLNLYKRKSDTTTSNNNNNNNDNDKPSADYLTTGCWSLGAMEEAKKYLKINEVSSNKSSNHSHLPLESDWKLSKSFSETNYFHYCHNETVHGVEFRSCPNSIPSDIPIICDMSSCFLSRPINDIERYSLIYSGVQKNVGPAGVTIILVKKSLLNLFNVHPLCPLMMNYSILASKQSMYNTPPCWSIYITGLVLKWIKEETLEKIRQQNDEKAQLLYNYIDNSNGFYISTVKNSNDRSRMNVNFKLSNESLLNEFIKSCESNDLIGLSGHRSVGGCRASIYNAVKLESVKKLLEHMKSFQSQHRK